MSSMSQIIVMPWQIAECVNRCRQDAEEIILSTPCCLLWLDTDEPMPNDEPQIIAWCPLCGSPARVDRRAAPPVVYAWLLLATFVLQDETPMRLFTEDQYDAGIWQCSHGWEPFSEGLASEPSGVYVARKRREHEEWIRGLSEDKWTKWLEGIMR